MNICWENDYCVTEMNRFYDKHLKTREHTGHLDVVKDFLKSIEYRKLIDLGCGTAVLSEFVLWYEGADLPHIIEGCAKRNYPNLRYHNVNAETDPLNFLTDYDVVVMNALLDVMSDPLTILKKVLNVSKKYVVIHRQEITVSGKTHYTINDSYGGRTYHSIINRNDFIATVQGAGFIIEAEKNLSFTNWENNGNSFLLKKI